MLRGLVRGPARRPQAHTAAAQESGPTLAERLPPLAADERDRLLTDLVRSRVAAVLGHADPTAIEADRPVQELGFDSLTAVELRNQLGKETGLRLPTTLVYDHPTPQAVATYLAGQLVVEERTADAPVLDELSRLKGAIESAAADPDARDRITERLRAPRRRRHGRRPLRRHPRRRSGIGHGRGTLRPRRRTRLSTPVLPANPPTTYGS
ncbi:acyl carrier protein [Streptomyces diastatochromogenes]|nr:acyl carrier protein [Streptomyces diastatochromogenes]